MSNYGFLKEKTKEDHYVLGSGLATKRFGAAELMPKGHGWGAHKPVHELQNKNGLETMACTVYGSLNCWETLANFYGFKDFPKNCSERYNAILSGITREGGSPHKTCESIRSFAGVIQEEVLPFSEDIRTWEYYYSPNPMDESLLALGQMILKSYTLGHEWVFNGAAENKPAKLIAALARGPVAVSVHAWKQKNGKFYKDKGDEDNHWLQLLDYKEGKYWVVYDHYEQEEKKLVWDYDFYCAKLFFLKVNESGYSPVDLNYFVFILTHALNTLKKLWKR